MNCMNGAKYLQDNCVSKSEVPFNLFIKDLKHWTVSPVYYLCRSIDQVIKALIVHVIICR